MPPAGRKSIKSEKKPRVVHDNDDDSDEENRPPKADTLVDQQYRFKQIDPKMGDTRLRTLISELAITQKELKKSLAILQEAATDVAECHASSEEVLADDAVAVADAIPRDPDTIKKLDIEYRMVVDKLFELEARNAALSNIRQKLAQGEIIDDIMRRYEEDVSEPLDEYKLKTSRQKYMEHDGYVGFRKIIWEVISNGKAVPDIKKFIPAEEGDDEDDDIEIGAQTTDFRCPITLGLLEDPQTSTKCKHSYSKVGINGIFEATPRGQLTECPVTGCHAKLTRSDVLEDTNLKQRLELHKRREKEKTQAGRATQGGTQYQTIEDSDEDDE